MRASSQESIPVSGEPIAVAISDGQQVIVQTREAPASLLLIDSGERIALGGVSVADTGHDMFHTNPGGQSVMVCASCHSGGPRRRAHVELTRSGRAARSSRAAGSSRRRRFIGTATWPGFQRGTMARCS